MRLISRKPVNGKDDVYEIYSGDSEVFIGENHEYYVFLDRNTGTMRLHSKRDWKIQDPGGKYGDEVIINIPKPITERR